MIRGTRPQRRLRHLVLATGVAILVIVLDQLTKWWALTRLSSGPIHVVGTLDLELARNTGSAFSLFQGETGVLVALAVVLIAVLGVLAWRSATDGRAAVFGLIAGGAIGNLADRLFRGDHGAVVDFVDLHFWPTFNLADASIVVGCVLFVLSLLRSAERAGDPMTERTVVVPATLDGVRVDKAVALVADLSRSVVDEAIATGQVRVDGVTVGQRTLRLRAGQTLTVDRDDPGLPVGPEPDPSVVFEVVHEDRDLVVVDKPAGLVVHAGAGHRTGTLVHGLVARFPDIAGLSGLDGTDPDRPGIVHRLDRGTSGLMVVARTPGAYRALVTALAARRVRRVYDALVLGTVEETSGLVDAPIGRSATSPTRMAVSRRGKEARTRYHVERRFTRPGPATRVTATLETGRTHQIRVHLAAIGHPVVGDQVYGRGRVLTGLELDRPFLHAGTLGFDHPTTGEPVSWQSPLPEQLATELDRLA